MVKKIEYLFIPVTDPEILHDDVHILFFENWSIKKKKCSIFKLLANYFMTIIEELLGGPSLPS